MIEEHGAAWRYEERREKWRAAGVRFAEIRHFGWWFLHNAIAHPLLGLSPNRATIWLHDWSSQHLNRRARIFRSPFPQITSRWEWFLHNVVDHGVIAIAPTETNFLLHDVGAERMDVKDWV